MKTAELRVLSWNILADVFVRLPGSPHTAFDYVPDGDLDVSVRQKRIVALLNETKPDVVLLQEVQMDPAGDVFDVPQWLRLPGYEWLVPFGKAQTPKEWQATLHHNTEALGRPYVTHVATLFNSARLERKSAVCTSHSLLVTLQDRQTGALWTFGNLHLQADPGADTATRQKQLNSAVSKAEKSAQTGGMLLAGDCNDENVVADACVRVETGNTWSNGKEISRPDNVFVRGCRVVGVQEFWNGKRHIPNDEVPSDHAPILVSLAIH
jgi:endonuclease/exonuclease/phosphatase family metal-dependent hydrolase